MGRIAAGLDFGNEVAQLRADVAMPRAAFGVTQTAEQIGVGMEREGLRQLREEEHAARVAREKADAAVAVARLNGIRDSLNDAMGEIDRGVMDGSIEKDAASKAWQERSAEIIASGVEAVPAAHREAARVDTQGLAQRLTSGVSAAVRKRDQQDTLSAIDQTYEYTQRLATTDPAGARKILSDTLAAVGPAAGLAPDKAGRLMQKWVEDTSYTRAFTAVNAAKGDNRLLAEVERGLSKNEEIDPQRKAALMVQVDNYRAANEARAIRAAQHAEIVAARRQRESDSAYKILSGWVLSGKMANPDAASGLIAQLTPQAAAAYKQIAAEVPARAAAAMLPLDAQQQQLDDMYQLRNTRGTSQALETEIARREQVLRQSRDDYQRDPLRAGQERGILDVPLRPLNVSSIDGLAAGVAERVEQARTVQTRTGRPVSPLLSDEAAKLGQMLQALPVTQRAERISQISALIPADQAQALAGQIVSGQGDDKKALGLAFALGAARTTNGRATAELALRGAEALKAKTIKEEKTAVDGWRGQISTQLDGLYANPRQAELAGDVARLILAGLVSEGAGGSSADAKQAVRLAVGGTTPEYNGARIIVPAGIEVSDIRKMVGSMTPADLAPQLPDGSVYVGGKPLPVADFLARLPDAQLQYVSRGRYAVKTQGTYAANARREPIIITVGPHDR